MNEKSLFAARAALAAAYPHSAYDEGITDLVTDLLLLADAEKDCDMSGYGVLRSATMHYEAEAGGSDEHDLAQFVALIREHAPGAVTAHVQTSDQDRYGFGLVDVIDADGNILPTSDNLADLAWEYLCNLTWDHVVGEDNGGFASVTIRHDHAARPDDDSEAGDRCKDCGDDITWNGPSQYDWEHVSDQD